MLQTLSEKMQGWPAIIVLGIATFAMAFFGIQGYFSSHADNYVARFGKNEISQQQFRARMNVLRQQAMAVQGERFDGVAFDSTGNKRRILGNMIDQQLLQQEGRDLGLRVSSQALRDAIAGMPGFQVNGRFDADTYRAELAYRGMTPEMFEHQKRSTMAVLLLPQALIDTTLVTRADVDRYLALQQQRRDIRYFILPKPDQAERNKVSKAEIASYYKNHSSGFMQPERVSLQYIELDDADMKTAAVKPGEEELRKRYQQEKSRFVLPEQRLVSHILIKLPQHATAAQENSALTRARQIAARATAGNFARLASQSSADLGSKKQGGDLGWVQHGLTDPVFDHALFALKKGQISSPVKAADGYHIIYLRNIRRGRIKSFHAVRSELVKEATRDMRERRFNQLAGQLTDATYQTPGSLDGAARKLHLPLRHTALFSRRGGTGIAANARVIKAAFSDDVLAQGNNSSLITLGRDNAVVIRVDRHQVKTLRPLAEVGAAIKQKILHDRLLAATRRRAHDLLARLRQGEAMQAVARSVGARLHDVKDVRRMEYMPSDGKVPAAAVPASLRHEAFVLPHPDPGRSSHGVAAMGGGTFALLAVDRVHDSGLPKPGSTGYLQLRAALAQNHANLSLRALVNILRQSTSIKIAEDRM